MRRRSIGAAAAVVAAAAAGALGATLPAAADDQPTVDVYRFANPSTGYHGNKTIADHYFATSPAVPGAGWTAESVNAPAFRLRTTPADGYVPLRRCVRTAGAPGGLTYFTQHNYTLGECTGDEGVLGYARTTPGDGFDRPLYRLYRGETALVKADGRNYPEDAVIDVVLTADEGEGRALIRGDWSCTTPDQGDPLEWCIQAYVRG